MGRQGNEKETSRVPSLDTINLRTAILHTVLFIHRAIVFMALGQAHMPYSNTSLCTAEHTDHKYHNVPATRLGEPSRFLRPRQPQKRRTPTLILSPLFQPQTPSASCLATLCNKAIQVQIRPCAMSPTARRRSLMLAM